MKDLNKVAFEELIEEDGETCLVIFSKKECPVCKQVHPKLDELENEYPNFKFYHIDVEENESMLTKCKIKGVPQVIYYKDGEEDCRLIGNHDVDEYADRIEELL